MKEELNSGVRCNVSDCVYNDKGANCNKLVIDVSMGEKIYLPEGETPHFCKSYICKECNGSIDKAEE